MLATTGGRPLTGGPIGYTQRGPLTGLHSGVCSGWPRRPCSASACAATDLDAGSDDAPAEEAATAARASTAASTGATDRARTRRRPLSLGVIPAGEYSPLPAQVPACHIDRPDARLGDRGGSVGADPRRRSGRRVDRPLPRPGGEDPVPGCAVWMVQPARERGRPLDPDAP